MTALPSTPRTAGLRAVGLTAALAVAAALGIAAALGATVAAAAPAVSIVDFAFEPATITIRQHEVVTWRNDGPGVHTVTADDGSFDSGELAASDQFANVFDTAGTFTYHCAIHSRMTGTVIVEPVAATAIPSGPTPPLGTLPPSFNAVVTPPPAATPATPTATPTAAPAPAPDSGSTAPLIVGLVVAGAGLAGLAYLLARRRASR